MKLRSSIYLCDDQGVKFFGEGPYQLLCGIQREGSLRAAASSMGMAYTKAFRLVRQAEAGCGFPLTMRKIGGEGGGGSRLTPAAETLMRRYEAFRAEWRAETELLYRRHFADFLPLPGAGDGA